MIVLSIPKSIDLEVVRGIDWEGVNESTYEVALANKELMLTVPEKTRGVRSAPSSWCFHWKLECTHLTGTVWLQIGLHCFKKKAKNKHLFKKKIYKLA